MGLQGRDIDIRCMLRAMMAIKNEDSKGGGCLSVVRPAIASVPSEGTSLLVLGRGVGPVLLCLVVRVVGIQQVVGVILPPMEVLLGIPVNCFYESSCAECEVKIARGMGKNKKGKINKQTQR